MCQFNNPIQQMIQHYKNTEIKIIEKEKCLMEEFIEEQKSSKGKTEYILLSCPCSRCSPASL